MINAALVLQYSDKIEDTLRMTPTPEDQQKLRENLPKLSAVERSSR
jgi:hypothetical protein